MKIVRLVLWLIPFVLLAVVLSWPDPKLRSLIGPAPGSPYAGSLVKPVRTGVRPFALPVARPIHPVVGVDWNLFEASAASTTPSVVLDVANLPELQGWELLRNTFVPLSSGTGFASIATSPAARLFGFSDVTIGSGCLQFDSMKLPVSEAMSLYRRSVPLAPSHAIQLKARIRVPQADLAGKPLSTRLPKPRAGSFFQESRKQLGFTFALSGAPNRRIHLGVATGTITEGLGVVIARGDYTRPTDLCLQLAPGGNWRFLVNGTTAIVGAGNEFRGEVQVVFGDWNDGMKILAELEALELKVFPCSMPAKRASGGPLMDHSVIIRHIEQAKAEAMARAIAHKKMIGSGSTMGIASLAKPLAEAIGSGEPALASGVIIFPAMATGTR